MTRASILRNRLPLLLAVALMALAAALLLWPAGPAQAQSSDAPAVDNLRCIFRTDVVSFQWNIPEWSGGETVSYDYRLTLPDGSEQSGRRDRRHTMAFHMGNYQPGQAARFRITANYETPGGSTVAGTETTATCRLGELAIWPNNATRQ